MTLSPPVSAAPAARSIARWLYICALAVFLMAVIGAVTRLTESGLSMVRWEPVIGALPPLTAEGWEQEFADYRQSPQYLKINHGMSLEDFKKIYFWEWLHRLWGRMIGLVYALPLLWFWARGAVPAAAKPALLGLLALGGGQGAMGWYMVQSGLVDLPAVSHYRLAAHLMLAFLIYALLFRQALRFSGVPAAVEDPRAPRLRRCVIVGLVLAALTMVCGAFVAGLDAGLLYNTFPKMDAHWLPPEMAAHRPVIAAFFEEPATVQFTHRVLALLTAGHITGVWFKNRHAALPPRAALLWRAMPAAVWAQAGLGIATLLTGVNIVLATLHQAGALVLLTVLVWLLHDIPKQKNGTA